MLLFQNEHNGQTKLLDLDADLVLFPQVRYTVVNKMSKKRSASVPRLLYDGWISHVVLKWQS